jgi:hypothetical protein
MRHRRTIRYLCSLVVCTLAACGGANGGGIGGTGIVVGPIEELGSIVVDGIVFDTDTAEVAVDGDPADASALELGMVVAVEGAFDRDTAAGVADFVRFESLLRGPVDAFDVASGEISLLGVSVLADSETVLDGVALGPSIVGASVEVSGFTDGAGAIRATRVAARSDGRTDLVVFGLVRDLDAGAETFRLRTAVVDYSNAAILGGTLDGLKNGTEVRVRFSSRPVGGVIEADTVSLRPPTIGDAGTPVIRMAGFVTEVVTRRLFVLDDRFVVRLADDTEFVGGGPQDVVVDARLGIEGRARRDRVIDARRVFVGGRDRDVVRARD